MVIKTLIFPCQDSPAFQFSDEWYTPQWVVDAVKEVLGQIDLDPATNDIANQVIGAKSIFNQCQDGLKYTWHGKVFLNPPFSRGNVQKFVNKLHIEYIKGYVTEAILILNSSTETKISQMMLRKYSVCFLNRRIKFWNPTKTQTQNRSPQLIFYLGNNQQKFESVFNEFGLCWIK